MKKNLVVITIKHMVHVERGSPSSCVEAQKEASFDDGERRTALSSDVSDQ